MEEIKTESWNEGRSKPTAESLSSRVQCPRRPSEKAGLLCSHVKVFTSCGLYSWLLEIPPQVERTCVLADS